MPVRVLRRSNDTLGLKILESILFEGLVCTSEVLRAWTDPIRVAKLGVERELHSVTRQTRACFTLCTAEDLARPHATVRFLEPSGREASRSTSHLELFGSFGIGINPLGARRIGIMPAMYFYTLSGAEDGGPEDVLWRLAEARQSLVALHVIEELSGKVPIPWIHTSVREERSSSEELGLSVSKEEVKSKLNKLTPQEASRIFDLFALDRRTSWQIIDKIDFVLGLFQNTDSFVEDSPLAFYEQREWRLPYISQKNLRWYSLGVHPRCRDPDGQSRSDGRGWVRRLLESGRGKSLSDDEAKATWVLYEVDSEPFAHLIEEVVCPPLHTEAVRAIVTKAPDAGRMRSNVRIKPLEPLDK